MIWRKMKIYLRKSSDKQPDWNIFEQICLSSPILNEHGKETPARPGTTCEVHSATVGSAASSEEGQQ